MTPEATAAEATRILSHMIEQHERGTVHFGSYFDSVVRPFLRRTGARRRACPNCQLQPIGSGEACPMCACTDVTY